MTLKYLITNVIVAIVLWLFLVNSANAWSLFSREVIIYQAPVEKTLDSEIDRLAIKYDVASSSIRAIIKCESQMYGNAVNHNRNKDGSVWSTDYGYLQVNDYFHEENMEKLGLDIHNSWDSLEYGFILFKSQGFSPWKASQGCWSKLI